MFKWSDGGVGGGVDRASGGSEHCSCVGGGGAGPHNELGSVVGSRSVQGFPLVVTIDL